MSLFPEGGGFTKTTTPEFGLRPRNSGLKGPHTYAQPFLTPNGTWPTSLVRLIASCKHTHTHTQTHTLTHTHAYTHTYRHTASCAARITHAHGKGERENEGKRE